MKKILSVIICAAMIAAVLAGQVNALALTVLDTSAIDFGTMSNGEWKEISSAAGYYNRLKVDSTVATVWRVTVKVANELTNADLPAVTIPNSNFKWMSTYAGAWNGAAWQDMSANFNHLPASGYVDFSLTDELVYTSGLVGAYDDSNNSANGGTEMQFKYGLSMPAAQTAGTYNTTVTYTVTQ